MRVRVIAKSGIVLLCGAMFAAHALTLGELRGEAQIGRALDLSIPFQSTSAETLSEACIRADIYFSEARQKPPRITIQAAHIRLQLAESVNEPVVNVQIRTFCGASQIRNYVLLADLPPDFSSSTAATAPLAASPPPAESPGTAPATAVVLPQAGPKKTAQPGAKASRRLASSSNKTKKVVKKAKTDTNKRPRDRKPVSAPAAKSVLKLDPLEILSDRMDNLELNMPFVPAEDALLQSRQIAALQAEVKSMRELAVKNEGELRSQLQQAQTRQGLNTLLYGLIALLLIGVAGLTWLWRGQKKLTTAAQSWWQHASDEDMTAFLQPEVQAKSDTPAALPPSAPTPADIKITSQSGQANPPVTQVTGSDGPKAALRAPYPALAVAPLTINPVSVQDVRQQADFFISLGQDHRAIQILKQHIVATELPNPLLCMDLLGLYQQASQTAEFNQLRDVCHQHFNVHLPDLATYQKQGRELESYPEVLTNLTRLWPGEQAQAFLDTCIFTKAAIRPQAPFDLAAFRELLTLHALAEELVLPVAPPDAPAATPPSSSTTNGLDLDFVLPEPPSKR